MTPEEKQRATEICLLFLYDKENDAMRKSLLFDSIKVNQTRTGKKDWRKGLCLN